MPTFEPDVVAAVLRHMNGDHLDDALLIVHAFADATATDASMVDLDGDGGTFGYSDGGEEKRVTIPWSAPITQRPEIRREVAALYDAACAKLGIPARDH